MNKYCILAETVQSRRKIIPVTDLEVPQGEMYTSLFYYDNEMLKYVNEHDTVSGFNGQVYSNFFILDLDGQNLKEVIADMQNFINWLTSQNCIYYIFFSGNKGFHIYLSTYNVDYPKDKPWNVLQKMFATQISKTFPKLSKYIDLSIYDKVRIFRFPYSIHQSTGYEKNLIEWLDYNENEPMKSFVINHRRKEDVIREIFIKPIEDGEKIFTIEDTIEIKEDKPIKSCEYFEYVYGEPYCITKILNTKNVKGERHKIGLRLLGYWYGKGYTKKFARKLLESWNEDIENPLHSLEIDNLLKYYETGYKFPCTDEVKSKYCVPSCQFYKRRELQESNIFTAEDYYTRYLKDKNASKDNWIYLGHKFDGWNLSPIKPGYVVVIAGGAGSGKTTFILNIMEFFQHINWLFFSLEMSGEHLVEMMLKMKNIDEENPDDIKRFINEMDHIITIDKPDISIDEIAHYVSMVNSSHAKINAITIDYLSLLQSKGHNQTERVIQISRTLKTIAKKLNVAIFVLSQVPKDEAGDGNLPLGLNSPKDSGEVVNLADVLLTCWRPNIVSKEPDDKFVVAVPKNRHGIPGYRVGLNFNGSKYQIS